MARSEQRRNYLPKLASGEWIGCFGLTEPEAGSDPGGMTTRAEKIAGGYRLTGAKTWISQRADRRRLRGLGEVAPRMTTRSAASCCEKGTKGLSAPKIEGKLSLRASITGEIVMEGVEVGEERAAAQRLGAERAVRLPQPGALRHLLGRHGGGGGLLAPARGNTGSTASSSASRSPATQLFQKKLADMQTEIALGLQASLRVGRLMDEGRFAPEMISLVKRNNCGKALDIARAARDMHGGNGIQIGYHVMRHAQNLETVNTYEGTHDVHALILGRAQTGLQAFF